MDSASAAPGNLTHLLQAWSEGDSGVLEKLVPAVYGQLRRIAQRCMSNESPGAWREQQWP
jgi:hypothetical protein